MNKLFLASSGLEAIKDFVGREPTEVSMLFVPTAGNLDEDVWWIDKDRDVLTKMGFKITEADITSVSTDELRNLVDKSDIVYIAGGNTFYLLKQLRDSGFDKVLTQYLQDGGMYAGASAGALVAGVDIAPVSTIDEPEKVDGLSSTVGLGFVNIVPIPHYDMSDSTYAIDTIRVKYQNDYELVLLTDDQAIIVENGNWKLVESKRSPLELEWFKKSHM